ncbi:J517_1871 family lipoprotein [Alcaligenes sp. SDU_A2]|uniref:J517_1871 family lipoprotein n=1 Tax=Alcaligenes sp. SDU_A2 TaxID=3136634 RepID=UPI00311D9063
MRLRVLGLIISSWVAGCALPTHDMADNRFAELTPELVSEGLVGAWTGSNGPYLLTLRIGQDGTGLFCSSWGERNTLGRIKFVQDRLYFQDGTKMRLSREGEGLVGNYDYLGANTVRFKMDSQLKEASPYCVDSLS